MAEKQDKVPDDIEASPMTHVPSQMGEILAGKNVTHDAVFGEVTEGGPNYRNVSFLQIYTFRITLNNDRLDG